MHIKATIVAYVISVQYFENATIAAYAGLGVKIHSVIFSSFDRGIYWHKSTCSTPVHGRIKGKTRTIW